MADIAGNIGMIKIKGDLAGNVGTDSGQVISESNLAGISIGGNLTHGSGAGSGFVSSIGTMGSVTIGANVEGGSIRAGDAIGAINIKGSIQGTASNPVVISARGQADQTKTDLAIKSLTVGFNVKFGFILGGYDLQTNAENPDAQIGAVKIGGSWDESSIVAGAQDSSHNGFGNGDDAMIGGADNIDIVSKIASIVIKGSVLGSNASGDHFGFVAQQIGSFRFPGHHRPHRSHDHRCLSARDRDIKTEHPGSTRDPGCLRVSPGKFLLLSGHR